MSNYFVRLLDKKQIRQCHKNLEEAAGHKLPLKLGDTFEIKAPDGDMVFSGIRKDSRIYICRLHKEVFAQ